MLAIALVAVLAPQTDAKAHLQDVLAGYTTLRSISMEIEHENSSGLFPGRFTQKLVWTKGGRFELLVTRKSDYRRAPGDRGEYAPDYYSDGSAFLSIWPDGQRRLESLFPSENTMPGWEVSGGLILGVLTGTPGSAMIFRPPKGVSTSFKLGKELDWRGERSREVQVVWSAGGRKSHITYLVSPDGKRLVGFEWKHDAGSGWAHYKNQQFDVEVPAALGTAPSVQP